MWSQMINLKRRTLVISRLMSLVKIPTTVVKKLTMVGEERNGAGVRKS